MDMMLVAVSLIISFAIIITMVASIAFLVFIFILVQEIVAKRRVRSLISSDFVTPSSRLAV